MVLVYDVVHSHNSFMVCTPFLNMLFCDTFKLLLEVKYCFMMNTWPLLNLSTECLITLAFFSLQDKLVFENSKCGHACSPMSQLYTQMKLYHYRFQHIS